MERLRVPLQWPARTCVQRALCDRVCGLLVLGTLETVTLKAQCAAPSPLNANPWMPTQAYREARLSSPASTQTDPARSSRNPADRAVGEVQLTSDVTDQNRVSTCQSGCLSSADGPRTQEIGSVPESPCTDAVCASAWFPKIPESVKFNYVFQPCNDTFQFDKIVSTFYDEYTALVKCGNVASKHVNGW